MSRRRVTEFLPFLLPLRRKQKIWCFYQKMKQDGNRYARRQAEERLPYIQYECTQGLINPDSGYDIQYQYNKAHNLKVVSRRMQQLIIEPGEVFSFWQLARGADHDDPYLPGLGLHDGKIVPVHGGGLCFMSELLYWMVLHTPLVITEHHHHDGYDLFPDFGRTIPFGTGTSILYNYLDYRFYNPTEQTFQILVHTDEIYLCGELRAEHALPYKYHVHAEDEYFSCEGESVYRNNRICRSRINVKTGVCEERTCIKINHAKVLYDSSGLPIRVLEKSTAGEDKP